MTKSTICFLLTLMVTAIGVRATDDKSVLEVKYDVTQRMYVEDEGTIADQMTLLVGEHSSLFMSATTELRKQLLDSLTQAATSQLGAPIQGGIMMSSGVQTMGDETYQVLKNYPAEGQLTLVDGAGGTLYRVEEELPIMDWNLVDGDTVIAKYACQKAITQWRGRTWTVWYTMDLPYSDGPWKLCGLPGLILAASDHCGDFTFECIAIKKGTSQPIKLESKTEKCTLKQLQTMKTKQAKDPVGFVLESLGLGGMLGTANVQVIAMDGSNGQPTSIPSRTPVFIEQIDK